jgi:hypothetical protein
MTFRDNIKCKRKGCGAVVKRKRFGQRYCSKSCRDLDAMARLRLRSANIAALEKPQEPLKSARLLPHREALTSALQPIDLTGVSEPVLSTYTQAFRCAVINVSGKSISRELLAYIITVETSRAAPKTSSTSRAIAPMMRSEKGITP